MSQDSSGHITGKLNANNDDEQALVVPRQGSFGFRFSSRELKYHSVPHNFRQLSNENPRRVILKFGPSSSRVAVGLDIFGDIVLGRGATEEDDEPIHVDLDNLDAVKLGVSRRHAMLRPTRNKLFLIDLDSTNGSYVNMVPVGRGMAQEIKDGDTIALAGLSFEIEFRERPRVGSLLREGEQPHSTTLKVETGDLDRASDTRSHPDEDVDSTMSGDEDTIELPKLQDQTADEGKVGVETLPPGELPYVKGLRKPPVRPISKNKNNVVRKPKLKRDNDDDMDE